MCQCQHDTPTRSICHHQCHLTIKVVIANKLLWPKIIGDSDSNFHTAMSTINFQSRTSCLVSMIYQVTKSITSPSICCCHQWAIVVNSLFWEAFETDFDYIYQGLPKVKNLYMQMSIKNVHNWTSHSEFTILVNRRDCRSFVMILIAFYNKLETIGDHICNSHCINWRFTLSHFSNVTRSISLRFHFFKYH